MREEQEAAGSRQLAECVKRIAQSAERMASDVKNGQPRAADAKRIA